MKTSWPDLHIYYTLLLLVTLESPGAKRYARVKSCTSWSCW